MFSFCREKSFNPTYLNLVRMGAIMGLSNNAYYWKSPKGGAEILHRIPAMETNLLFQSRKSKWSFANCEISWIVCLQVREIRYVNYKGRWMHDSVSRTMLNGLNKALPLLVVIMYVPLYQLPEGCLSWKCLPGGWGKNNIILNKHGRQENNNPKRK